MTLFFKSFLAIAFPKCHNSSAVASMELATMKGACSLIGMPSDCNAQGMTTTNTMPPPMPMVLAKMPPTKPAIRSKSVMSMWRR